LKLNTRPKQKREFTKNKSKIFFLIIFTYTEEFSVGFDALCEDELDVRGHIVDLSRQIGRHCDYFVTT
jgi:hypothetical protein